MNTFLVKTDIHFVLGKYFKINICAYKTMNGVVPFKVILLINDENPTIFSLPTLDIKGPTHNFSQIDKFIFHKLSEILNINHLFKNDYREKYTDYFNYCGYYEYENELYVFIEIIHNVNNINNKIIISDETDRNIANYVLISEITNEKHLYGIQINPKLVDFVLNNISLFALHNSQGIPYEHPIIGYVGKKRELLHYICAFGISSSSFGSIFGPYYYFTNYENAKNSQCIFRFALCLGNTLVKENFPNDIIVESHIKEERLNMIENNNEKMKLRISDYYGEWTSNYDSVILPNIDLDDGSHIENTPIFCIKIPEQFKCLGCLKRETKINILENI